MTLHRNVHIGARQLPGELVLVPGATGLVLFVHGSGSSRRSPRNRHVAEVVAVVSRGGRPDLASDDLPRVLAPTLLILGGEDRILLPLHREAIDRLRCARHLAIVPGATHLFEQPGTLDTVGWLAACWFADHLGNAARPVAG